jgi:hypothetical protein
MSHVSTVKTSIKDLNILKDALKTLGLGFYEGQSIKGQYLGAGQKVDLVIDNKGDRNVGMTKDKDGNFSFVGDFYQVKGGKKNFTEDIIQKYTVLQLRMELRKFGAASVSEIAQEDGSVKLFANL